MTKYMVRRLLAGIPVILITLTIIFFAFASIPGDPAHMFAGPEAPGELIEALRRQFGTDQPLHIRYVMYIRNLFKGDLGTSFFSGRKVSQELSSRFVNTMKLAIVSIALSTTTGILFGVISAIKQNSLLDRLVTLASLSAISIPGFWLGLLLILFLSVRLGIFPTGGMGSYRHMILPALNMSVFAIAFIARMTRSTLLEVIRQEYIRTARAKGLPERIVIFKHALANALIPVVTVVGLRFGFLLGGAVVTEQVFSWPGMGRLLVHAVNYRDYYVVQGAILLFSLTFVSINTLVDLSYAYLDPRIRYS